ncbi:MAG: hypothetical protein M5U11_00745 [Anaerolineales bacterium]|nr:hypothetical protein [Anaerolineales bacterium]
MAKNNLQVSNAEGLVWFSTYYGLDEPQFKLPFVDFNLNSDVPLYIDPYAITKDQTDLAARCHNCIISYFQSLLDAIRNNNETQIRRLVTNHLSEPNEIHLGVGKKARGGRGIGQIQEKQVIDTLASSTAAKLGVIQTIQELELHIEGIGPDKVSDLIANIILAELATYTEEICQQYGIPTDYIAVSGFWNNAINEWDGGFFNLPHKETHSYILVPKRFVRRARDLMNHREFYDKYILSTLKQDLLSADDSLVQTLKTGERRVTKKSIREDTRFTLSKEFISEYIMENPKVMDSYRAELVARFRPADPAEPSQKAIIDDPVIFETLSKLKQISPGRDNADEYHEAIYILIQFIFDWALESFEKEFKMDTGRSRIDIISDNYASGGLFRDFIDRYRATTIPMECKNYGTDLGNDEFNQIMERLGPKTSQFGMVFCRKIDDPVKIIAHLGDRWLRHNCMIVLFDDTLVERLTHLRLNRDFNQIQRLLRQLIRAIEYRTETYY